MSVLLDGAAPELPGMPNICSDLQHGRPQKFSRGCKTSPKNGALTLVERECFQFIGDLGKFMFTIASAKGASNTFLGVRHKDST